MYDPTRPPTPPGQFGITSAPQGQRVAPAQGFQMPNLPQMGGGVSMPQINELVGGLPNRGVANMPNIGPRPMHGMNRGGVGNIQGFIDALRGWIGQRPEDMSQADVRQDWLSQRPTFQGFNSTPPEVI
jgi:hypothetical protein